MIVVVAIWKDAGTEPGVADVGHGPPTQGKKKKKNKK
jgi:hypothetical protein